MHLKPITFSFWLLLFLSLSTVAFAQPATRADIQALDKRVQALEARLSNLETKLDEMDKRLTNQIKELDNRVTIQIKELDNRMTIQIKELDNRMTIQIQAVNTRIDELDRHISRLLNILIGVVLAAIALPQLLGFFQVRRERAEFLKQIEELRQQGKQRQLEIEALKSRDSSIR